MLRSGSAISLLLGALMRMSHKLLLCAGLLAGAATTLVLAAREAQSAHLQREQLAAFADAQGQVLIARFFRMVQVHPKRLLSDDSARPAGRHPLLQWLLEYLRQRPKATAFAQIPSHLAARVMFVDQRASVGAD